MKHKERIIDLLLKRYQNIDYVLNLDIVQGIKMINIAVKEDTRDKTYQLWIHLVPHWSEDNFKEFEEFFELQHPEFFVAELSTKSTDSIIREVQAIGRKINEKGGS